MNQVDTTDVRSVPGAHGTGVESDNKARGFDNQINAAVFIALALVVLVRPRELNFLRLLPFIVPLFGTALYLASRTETGWRSVRVPFVVVVTVTWFVTSTAWSGARNFSIAESISIFCIAGMAALVGSFCSLRSLVGGVMAGCGFVLVASVAVGVALPSYGLVSEDYEAGGLQGIMLDRNSLSFVLLLGLVATLVFEFRGRRGQVCRFVLAALFFGGVLWTKSSTCLILAVVAFAMSAALMLPRRVRPARRGWALAAFALAMAALVPVVTTHIDELYKAVGRDATFTGRTVIWPVVQQVISTRPWIGHGWGGVWGQAPLQHRISLSVGFNVPHSHSGYLDLQLQVGAIGLILVFLVLLLVALRGIACYLKSQSSLSSWALILPVVLLIYNRVETSFSAPSTLFLLVVTLVVLGRENRILAGRTTDGSHGEPPGERSVPAHGAARASSVLIVDS